MNTEATQKKHLDDSDNEEHEDFLEVDAPLPGQNYVCLSFVTPQKAVAQKNEYYSYNFLKNQFELYKQIMEHEFNKLSRSANEEGYVHMDCINNLKNVLSSSANTVKLNDINNKCLQEAAEAEENKENKNNLPVPKNQKYTSFAEFNDYNEEVINYKFTNEDRMQEEFNEHVEFQTNVFGVKVRGTFESYKEARLRAKILQKKDKSFNVWVGQVGYWLPVDADPDKAQNSEHLDQQLDTIVKQYKENERKRDYFYNQRAEEEKKEAALRNKKMRQQQKSQTLENNENNETNETQEDKLTNSRPDGGEQNDDELKNTEEPTQTFNSNLIEELLKERKQEMSIPRVSQTEPPKMSAEAQQAGFDNIDPWMVRKLAQKHQEQSQESDDEDN
jgi:hypothetical protein